MPCRPACPACARLRATSLRTVGTDGIDALTIERLSRDVHLPPETVQAHYPNASDCLYDTYEEVALSIYEDFVAAFAAEQRWHDALRLAVRTLVQRMADRPAEARLCFAEILLGDYELLRRREASRRRLLELFVREHARRCDYPEHSPVHMELLIGAGFQAIASAVAEERVAQRETLAAELESRALIFEPAAA
jgi:AcrR family transcriptional regulator